jgi:hypothetical protein
MGSVYNGLTRISVAAWIRTDLGWAGNAAVIGKEGVFRVILTAEGAGHFVVRSTDNDWYTTGTVASFPSGSVTPDVWHHIVGTYDGSLVRVYVDGVLAGAGPAPVTGALHSNGQPFSLARKLAQNQQAYRGALDDVRVYDVALSDAEVLALFAGP